MWREGTGLPAVQRPRPAQGLHGPPRRPLAPAAWRGGPPISRRGPRGRRTAWSRMRACAPTRARRCAAHTPPSSIAPRPLHRLCAALCEGQGHRLRQLWRGAPGHRPAHRPGGARSFRSRAAQAHAQQQTAQPVVDQQGTVRNALAWRRSGSRALHSRSSSLVQRPRTQQHMQFTAGRQLDEFGLSFAAADCARCYHNIPAHRSPSR